MKFSMNVVKKNKELETQLSEQIQKYESLKAVTEKEVEELKNKNRKLDSENYKLTKQSVRLQEMCKGIKKYFERVTPESYEALYKAMAEEVDPDGFRLIQIAEKLTNIDVCHYFKTEDQLGYFEEANGYELLEWLIKAKFGNIEWIQLQSPYEKAGRVSFHGQEKNIQEFLETLYKKTVFRLLVEEEVR